MSPPKVKKSQSPWYTCEDCSAVLTQKDITLHTTNCPSLNEGWIHSFIRDGVLYSTIEVYKPQVLPKNISQRELNGMVFMAQSALQLCEISIGDPVLLTTGETSVVKTAWPTNDKSLTSVALTKNAMELDKLEGPVVVQRLKSNLHLASEVLIEYVGKQQLPKTTVELDVMIKNSNEQKIFCAGNKVSIPYYGKKLIYKITAVKVDKAEEKSLGSDLERLTISGDRTKTVECYKTLYSTKWTIVDNEKQEEKREGKTKNKMADIGGYEELIAEIRDVVDASLGKFRTMRGFNVTKGILLYGTAGVGKSMIANALISESDAEIFPVSSSEIYSKYVGETEMKLKEIFENAKCKAPSIIFMEDVDSLCPKRSSTGTEQERRVVAALLALFDELQESDSKVLVLATTSKPDVLDASLRRPGRIEKEFEVPVPTPRMRRTILTKFLSRVPNNLGEEDINEVSFVTHGFVGADLYSLCSRAAMTAMKRERRTECVSDVEESDAKLTMKDFKHALTIVKPSAMKEVLVEVPNVKWTDIGGQEDLKLKLKQAVEWPLKHPEAFVRMGITPPRGVLMFGPPGCSKTMIAKALATESKLNFLNIKGPELFSKWVGESEKAVREVFRKARQVAPSIIFIDEIDALGSERGSSSSAGGSSVQERVLAQLLTELDGVTALGNVTLVAATNRPDRIDKALLRPGRLDRIVYVPLPDFETRREIFRIKLRKMPVSEDVDVNDLVDLTDGYSGAEVQAICHEAAMKALEEDLDATMISTEHFRAALSIVTPRTPSSLIKLYEDYLNKK